MQISQDVPPAVKDKWRSYPSNLDISPSKMRWEIKFVLTKDGNHGEKQTSFIFFPPFWTKLPGEKLGAGDTTQWAQCQCHPQDEFTLRNSHGHPMEDLGRSVFCHTPATFGNSGGVFWCVITFNLALQTHKSSHPPQVSLPLRQQRPQCQQWQRQRRRTLHWYGLKIWKGLVRLCPQWHWLFLAWYV